MHARLSDFTNLHFFVVPYFPEGRPRATALSVPTSPPPVSPDNSCPASGWGGGWRYAVAASRRRRRRRRRAFVASAAERKTVVVAAAALPHNTEVNDHPPAVLFFPSSSPRAVPSYRRVCSATRRSSPRPLS